MAPTSLMRPIKKDWQRQSQSESEDDDLMGKKDLMPLVMSQGELTFCNPYRFDYEKRYTVFYECSDVCSMYRTMISIILSRYTLTRKTYFVYSFLFVLIRLNF